MNILLAVSGITAGIISLLAYPPYIRDIFKGSTKPQRATWLIWTVLSGIALAGQVGAHAKWSLLMTLAQTFGVTLIFVLSLRFGTGGLQRRDILSLAAAGLGLVLWALTNEPLVALAAVILVDTAGAWLTVAKAYRDPGSETLITWWLDSISNLFGLMAVGTINLTLLSYPAYLLLANTAVVIAIYSGRRRHSENSVQ